MLDIIIKAETEGLDTEEEVVEYAIAIIDSKLYKSAGHFGRFLASLQETELWAQVEAHYAAPAESFKHQCEYCGRTIMGEDEGSLLMGIDEHDQHCYSEYEIAMGLDN